MDEAPIYIYIAQCLTYGKHSIIVHSYYLHQNHGANEFVLEKNREKRRRMKTKSGEPTLEEKVVVGKGVRE